jgi:homoserine kinase
MLDKISTSSQNPHCVVNVPATSANLGVGFDTFGLALSLWNRFELTKLSNDCEPQLKTLEGSAFSIGPKSGWDAVSNNVFFEALSHYYQAIEQATPPYEVGVHIQIPVARGLGSSATAVVAALLGANTLEGHPLNKQDLLQLAIAFEGHPDNVSPALKGGCVFGDESQVYSLSWPSHWQTAVWMPEDPLLTEAARHVLPNAYSRQDTVQALRQSALLLYAIEHQDAELLRRVLEQDVLHEPYRKNLIEGFDAFRRFIHRQTESLGVVISGSGSTCLVIFETPEQVKVMHALDEWQRQWGGTIAYTPIEHQGAYVIL